MASPDSKLVHPCRRIRGTIRVPGDKSISHRAAMLSAVASRKSTISGFLTSEDCVNTLRAMEALGAGVRRRGTRVTVNGTGGSFHKPDGALDMGNSGTGMRLAAGLLAGQEFTAEMTGDASLRSRPMRRIKEPLEMMGAKVELLGSNGCAPVRITGGNLKGIEYKCPVASAQVKSCVLLAALFAEGTTTVIEPEHTRDHTERMFAALGVDVRCDGLSVSVPGSAGGAPSLKARDWNVPGDFSSAAFWIVAAASREGAEVTIENVGLNPRRTALLAVLKRMGAEIEVRDQRSEVRGQKLAPPKAGSEISNLKSEIAEGGEWEPAGTITIRGTRLKGAEVGGSEIPNLIDELPILAVAGALADGRTVIRDAAELRVKESDRIAAMAAALAVFGVKVDEKPDGMIVAGNAKIKGGAEIDSRGDHRIAMAAAILALFADQPVRVLNVACVATSYPGFWNDLLKLTDSHVE